MNELNELAEVLAGLNDKKSIADFLKELLTESEMKNISLRWELLKLLEKGISQRSIAKKLGVSLCKITRGSRELKKKDSALKKVMNTYCFEHEKQ
ncbi:MAG: transcriptional regulator [Spirochaetales bacterium]|nr:transcriptional regulator [Spirochaetales bacterium]